MVLRPVSTPLEQRARLSVDTGLRSPLPLAEPVIPPDTTGRHAADLGFIDARGAT